MATERRPIEGRVAWYGAALTASPDWIYRLDERHQAEIDAALVRVNRARTPLFEITRDDFPLAATADLLAEIAEELEDGRGMVRLRGLPAERYGEEDLRRLFWGLGTHLGTALYQNARGELMGEVRDEFSDAAPSYVMPSEGKVRSSRARARSNGPLRFHTDRSDVIALLCARNAAAGGVSKLASIATIHNEILARRPDLLEVLFRDFWRARPEDEDGLNPEPIFALPVLGTRDGKITSQYSRTYVEQGQEYPQAPRLTPDQIAAMDLLAEVAEAVCLLSPFETGDIQLLNNHVIYHGRTAYEDDPRRRQERLLFRLWLAMPNSRALPEGFDVLWGSTLPGALRGGVPQPDGARCHHAREMV